MDPRWTPEPPADQLEYALPLIRTPSQSPLIGVILSPAMVGCPTHYFGGRTIPCTGDACPACLERQAWRWHGYLHILRAKTHEQALLELTAQAAETITDWFKRHGKIRGVQFRAERPSRRPNGRVVLLLKTFDDPNYVPPPAKDVRKCMAIIWQLPLNQVKRGLPLRGAPEHVNEPHEGNGHGPR